MAKLESLVNVPEAQDLPLVDRAALAYYFGNILHHNRTVSGTYPQHVVEELQLVKKETGSVDDDNPGSIYFLNAKTRNKNTSDPYGLDGLSYDIDGISAIKDTSLGIMENGEGYLVGATVIYEVNLNKRNNNHKRI